jgi:hypothetical protein
MNSEDKSLYVTRRDFYTALTIVWSYIMLILADLLRIEFRKTTAVLCAASVGMIFAYAWQGLREGRTPPTASQPSGPTEGGDKVG